MIYLHWYLGVGTAILALIVATHGFSKKSDQSSLSAILADLRPERGKLWFRLLNNVIGPALIGLLALPFWPILVLFKIKQMISSEPEKTSFEDPVFAVTREDLLVRTEVSEIEAKEMVVDPMGAVPNLPFGHLNRAWRQFLDGMQPTDAIWTFAAKWTHWGRSELWQGYVAVREDGVGPFFLTSRKELEGEPDPSAEQTERPRFVLPSFLKKQAD